MNRKRAVCLGLFLAAVTAADQITKALVRANIPYGDTVALLPGVVQLRHVRNPGAAFSMLGGFRWFFLALVLVFFVGVGILIKKKVLRRPAELWALAAIGGGALGNAIDRALCGEVTDMIDPLFIDFAVFNVADCFITCGAVFLAVYVVFFDRSKEHKQEEGRGKKEA